MLLLSDEQQQALQQSLQALTDEEKQQVSEQTRLQNARQWLVRGAELTTEDRQAQTALREAQAALEQAQPQLTVLLNAQPAEQLRPQWTRQQEQIAALAQTRNLREEVNTRLHERLRLRAGIRLAARQQSERLQNHQQTLAAWLKEHDRYQRWGNALAGWRAAFQQQARDTQQQTALQQRLAETSRRLGELPPTGWRWMLSRSAPASRSTPRRALCASSSRPCMASCSR